MANDYIDRIARLLLSPGRAGAMYGASMPLGDLQNGVNTNSVMLAPHSPTPPAGSAPMMHPNVPPLPNFQIPGLNTLSGAPFSPTQMQALQAPQASPQAPAMPPMSAPVPIGPASGMQPPASPGVLPPLPPPIQIGAAPGMGPQGNPQLDEWRRALDAMQFARQGQ